MQTHSGATGLRMPSGKKKRQATGEESVADDSASAVHVRAIPHLTTHLHSLSISSGCISARVSREVVCVLVLPAELNAVGPAGPVFASA